MILKDTCNKKTKQDIRLHIKDKYANRNNAIEITNDVFTFLDNMQYNKVGLYFPIKFELRNDCLLEYLIKNDKDVYFPYMKKVNKDFIFEYHKYNKDIVLDDLNISSYSGDNISPLFLDIIFIPGLAFNINGYRIGYGKGCYDMLLNNYKGIKIGICHDDDIIKKDFQECHDIKMNYIITEKRIIKIN